MSCFAIIEMTQDQGQVVARLIPDEVEVEQAGIPDTIALADTPVQKSKSKPTAGSAAETVHRELAQRLGAARLGRLVKDGKLVISEAAPESGVAGAYQNGVVTLYPENIAAGQAWSVFLHEAGEHAGLEQMLGDKYPKLIERFDALVREKNVDAIRAVERVPADTPAEHVNSERLAYLIEDFTQQQTKTGKVKLFVQGLLAAIRAWAFATLPKGLVGSMQLSPADIQALAVRAARGWARSTGANNLYDPIRYSKKAASEARESGLSASGDANLWSDTGRTRSGLSVSGMREELAAKLGAARVKRLLMLGKLKLVQSVKDLPKAIQGKLMVAWHGSPHDFDKFALKHLGSGEGQQVYGWGLYFAGNREVAEWYKNVLAEKQGAEGRLYQVDIPDEGGYLLWDAMADEQPSRLLDKLKMAMPRKEFERMMEGFFENPTGAGVYDYLKHQVSEGSSWMDKILQGAGFDVYSAEYGQERPDKLVSIVLSKLGINGIKFLDGSSRSKGAGHYNYVIFDDAAVQVIEKYSKDNNSSIAGVFDGDAVWMVADNIPQGEAWSVFLHEAGEHAGLEQMLGDKYANLVQRFDALVREKNPDAIRAVERVPADTPAEHVHSERLAYLIEDFTQQQTKTGKVKLFVQGLLAAIRAWAFATLPTWLVGKMQLSPADIQALAVRAARGWARSTGANNLYDPIRYSKKATSEARESGFSTSGNANLWAELQAQAPKEGVARNKELLGKGWQWTKDHIQEVVKTGGLGLLTLRQLAEIGRDVVPAMQKYMALTERMLTERNQMADESGKLAERWTKLDKASRQKLAFVMHKATLERVDPSLDQVPDPEIMIRVADLEWREKLGLARPASLLTEIEPERLAVNDKTLKLLRKRYIEANNKALRSRGKRERFEQLQQVADSLLGDWKAAKAALQQHERALPVFERLQQQFRALSPEAQAIYTESRDMYEARFARKHQALIESINRSVMPEEKKKALGRTLQQEFESAKLQGVYFPLHRQGAYFVRGDVKKEQVSETVYFKKAGFERINRGTGEVTQEANTWDSKEAALRSANSRSDLIGKDLIAVEKDGGWVLKENPNEPVFLMFPTAAEAERESNRLQADPRYSDVRMGKLNKQNTQDELGRAGVLMQTMTAMKANNQDVPDELYQLMLEMLPELSMRKNSIHRKGVQGFSADALNAFGHQMLHQAHQISKLEARDQLAQALSDIEEQAKLVPNEQRMLAGNLREAMKKRHDWVMSPRSSPWTNWASSFGFVMYLGLSPAAALVNLSQVAVLGYPALAAKYGWVEAAKVLNATARQLSLREVVLGDDAIARGVLSADERTAMERWHDMGAIDKTQAQMLAGVADNDALSNSPTYQRAMGKVAHLFHKAEVVNREVMLLSAYRLARAKGETHDRAIQYASDVTWETQFDYSSVNSAGFMHNDFAKVALMFKSYSQHMIYFLLRNARQWGKGGADAKEARSKLLGILAVTLAMGGVSALPLGFVGAATGFAYAQAKFGTKAAAIGTVGAVAGLMVLSAAVLDDEEDWESELRKALRSMGGEPLETLVFRGAVNLTTGVDLSSRISLDDLLLRDNDRELEGADAKGALLEQLAGPVVGYGVNALYTVPELWSQDHEWRAVEKLMPKFARDWMQTARFGTEGALTMKGSPVVEKDLLGLPYSDELNLWNLFWKANGFNAEKLTGQYVANNDFMNAKKRVQDSREKVLNRLFVASMENDREAVLEAKAAIKNWNQAHPKAKQINEAAMKRSLAARLRARRENDQGVRLQAAEVYLRE